MTLEDGRRNLFWAKEDEKLAEWAVEKVSIACQLPGNPDATLINTGVKLSSAIPPDPTGDAGPFPIMIVRPAAGPVTISGTAEMPLSLVLESAGSLASPITWQPLQSNSVPAGPFSFTISGATNVAGFFRIRSQ